MPRQKRSDPVASRCTYALRRSRKGPSRRRCRPSTQEQKRLDTDAACDSEYWSWWLGLTRSESTTGADRRIASGAHYQTDLICSIWVLAVRKSLATPPPAPTAPSPLPRSYGI